MRNAAIQAALGAMARGGTIGREDVLDAVQLEHRKAGASFQRHAVEDVRDPEDAIARFVSVIS